MSVRLYSLCALLKTYLDEVVGRKCGAPQTRRSDFEHDVGIVPNSAGIDESRASSFIVVCRELCFESSAMFDQHSLESLLQEKSGILGSNGDSLFSGADYSEVLAVS